MDEIKRYVPSEIGVMIESKIGSWVRWDELIVLQSALQSAREEIERVRKERDKNIRALVQCYGDGVIEKIAAFDDIKAERDTLKAEAARMREAIKALFEKLHWSIEHSDIRPIINDLAEIAKIINQTTSAAPEKAETCRWTLESGGPAGDLYRTGCKKDQLIKMGSRLPKECWYCSKPIAEGGER